MIRHLILVICLMSPALFSASQTCIVIVKKGAKLVVAADSRQTKVVAGSLGGKLITTFLYYKTCKIRNYKNVFFAISGDSQDTVYSIARIACAHAKTIFEASQLFKQKLLVYSKNNLEQIRTINKPFFEEHYKATLITKIAFFGFENGTPWVISMVFYLKAPPPQPIEIETNAEYDSLMPTNFSLWTMYVLGHRNVIDTIPYDDKDALMAKPNLGESLKYLIHQEMKNDSAEIADPIDVLELTNSGANWIFRKNICK
jgi:hypothetical protein